MRILAVVVLLAAGCSEPKAPTAERSITWEYGLHFKCTSTHPDDAGAKMMIHRWTDRGWDELWRDLYVPGHVRPGNENRHYHNLADEEATVLITATFMDADGRVTHVETAVVPPAPEE